MSDPYFRNVNSSYTGLVSLQIKASFKVYCRWQQQIKRPYFHYRTVHTADRCNKEINLSDDRVPQACATAPFLRPTLCLFPTDFFQLVCHTVASDHSLRYGTDQFPKSGWEDVCQDRELCTMRNLTNKYRIYKAT